MRTAPAPPVATDTLARVLSISTLHARARRSGDVVLFNRRCLALPPRAAALCWASKFGISGSGRGCWDHAALVLRDRVTDVPYLLEGQLSGTTLRTYEERLLQGGDHDEVIVLPLRGVERSSVRLGRLDALLQARARHPRARFTRHGLS